LRAGRVAQVVVVECLPSEFKALSSNISTAKTKQKKGTKVSLWKTPTIPAIREKLIVSINLIYSITE
jgi:hypothetical protein